MTSTAPCPVESRLKTLLEGGLPADGGEELVTHIRQCASCRKLVQEYVPDDILPSSEARGLADGSSGRDAVLDSLLVELRANPPVPGDPTQEAPRNEDGTPIATSGDITLGFLDASQDPQSLGRLDDYEITGVIGSGGMGIVLKARDTRLERIVAIKVLKPELAANATARQRFVREAQRAAGVTHDHVVTIHAVGEGKGLPYIVMEYIIGVSLEERIRRTGPLKTEEILRIGMQAASGLAAAHAQGLVHRDIKPSNILLENGIERVKIADFGLARAADDAQITQTGVVAGTPAYMSPEQANERGVDQRSDIFSLGCVMYAMCTGRSPFRASTIAAAIHRVCQETPRPLREINSDVPDWLEQIIARMLEKDREKRYQTAAEVADLLGHHLACVQQPSAVFAIPRKRPAAMPASPTGAHKRLVPTAALATLALLAVAAGAWWLMPPSQKPVSETIVTPPPPTVTGQLLLEVPNEALRITVSGEGFSESRTGSKTYNFLLSEGTYLLEVFDPHPERQRIVFTETFACARDSVMKAYVPWDAWQQPPLDCAEAEQILLGHENSVLVIAMSADGQKLASCSLDGCVKIWERVDGRWQVMTTLARRNPQDWPRHVALSPDGEQLVVAVNGTSSRLTIWNLPDAKTAEDLDIGPAKINAMALPPDGRTVAVGCEDGTAQLWDITARECVGRLTAHFGPIRSVCFSPDGKRLATAGGDGLAKLWDTATLEKLHTLEGHTQEVASVVFIPQGNQLATAGADGSVKLWNADTGELIRTLGVFWGEAKAVTATSDGTMLAAAEFYGSIKLWDLKAGVETVHFRGHCASLTSLLFSPDGNALYSTAHDYSAREWDVEKLRQNRTIASTQQPQPQPLKSYRCENWVLALACAPEGDRFAAMTNMGWAYMMPMAGATMSPKFRAHEHDIPEGSTLPATYKTLAFIPESGQFITAGIDKTLKFWDSESLTPQQTMQLDEMAWYGAVSPSGRLIGIATQNGDVLLWDVEAQRRTQTLRSRFGAVGCIAFSADESTLFGGTMSGLVTRWDVSTGEQIGTPWTHSGTEVIAMTISTNGALLAVGSQDGKVALWDTGTGECAFQLAGHKERVFDADFAADNSILVTVGGDFNSVFESHHVGEIKLWDVATGNKITEFTAHGGTVASVTFLPNGDFITGGRDSRVHYWRMSDVLELADRK